MWLYIRNDSSIETANAYGFATYLVDDVSNLDPRWFQDVEVVGISAGAIW